MAAGDLFDAAADLLDAATTVLSADGSGLGAPANRYVVPGTPAADSCDVLVVGIGPVRLAPTGPVGALEDRNRKDALPEVPLTLWLLRCRVPTGAAPPNPTALTTWASQDSADAWALWNGLRAARRAGSLWPGCRTVMWGDLAPVEPAGGIAGRSWTITVGLDGYTPGS